MASTNRPYRRLPGTGYRRTVPGWAIVLLFFVIGIFALLFRGRRIQLWQGEEHLLLVKWDGYRESYKRFDYRDIQALVVRKTPDGTIVNTVLLVVFCLFAGLALAVSDVGGRITLLFLAGIFGMLALVNALYGPTCRCALRTAGADRKVTLAGPAAARARGVQSAAPAHRERPGRPVDAREIPARLQEWIAANAAAVPAAGFVVDDPNAPPRIVARGIADG